MILKDNTFSYNSNNTVNEDKIKVNLTFSLNLDVRTLLNTLLDSRFSLQIPTIIHSTRDRQTQWEEVYLLKCCKM